MNSSNHLFFDPAHKQTKLTHLIDCQAVVEKKEFISTGKLTYIQGEILEIEILNFEHFNLGDAIKITIYSPSGMLTFITSLVAKDSNLLIAIFPPSFQKFFDEQRNYPRIEVPELYQSGQILSILPVRPSSTIITEIPFQEPLSIQVQNISLSGVGFVLSNQIKIGSTIKMNLLTEELIECQVEIVREEIRERQYFYGTQFRHFPSEKLNSYRAFILKIQIDKRKQERSLI